MSRWTAKNRLNRALAFVGILFLFSAMAGYGSSDEAFGAMTTPEIPRFQVDTTVVPPSGKTIAVPAGGDFQEALDAARPGDTITLEAGATFTGPFTLPNKSGTGWITIRTSAPDRLLPPSGTRIDPTYAALMPKLEALSGSVIATDPGAHHYRLIGIEIRPREGRFLYNLIELNASKSSIEKIPHHIVFDRCYLHGDPKKGSRRGIAMNSAHTAVIDSYLSDFKEVGADSQAIAGWNGPGPFKIENNYLEGAGENVLFGGADSTIPNLVPSDIEIRHNHFSKPSAWRIGDPGYAGTPWTVKNLFELKNARRVLIEGNLFEHNWVHAQKGFSILFTVRNQDGGNPWAVVEDITFVNNVIRHTSSAMSILGYDDNHASQQTKRIAIVNNLFEDVGGDAWGGQGVFLQVLDGTADLLVDHNTVLQAGSIIVAEGKPNPRFVFKNNIVLHNANGITGSGAGVGRPALERYFPGAVVKKNVIVGGNAALYPPENAFPESIAQAGFVNRTEKDYRLSGSSPFRNAATDGRNIGVDLDAVSAAGVSSRPRR